jgi:hypothetical protein
MRLSRAIAILSALLSAAPVAAQTHSPVTLPGIFNQDTPDFNMTPGESEVRDALANAPTPDQVQKTAPLDCYTPTTRVQMVVVGRVGMGDPAFMEPLNKARMAALKAFLDENNLSSGVVLSYVFNDPTGPDGSIRVTYGPFDKDTNAPALRVRSDPPTGSMVTAGQTISVTIRASEREQDGHTSWPSGVQAIQLTDKNGLVKAWDYGKPPRPCTVQNEHWDYTVTDNPPPVVHLVVETEDAVGNYTTKTADFPTAPWYGTIKAHGQGNVYNDTVNMDFALSVGTDGVVRGKGHAKMTNAPQQLGPCYHTLKRVRDEADVAISGRLVDNQFVLKLANPPSPPTTATQYGCGSGGTRTLPIAFFAPMPLAPNFMSQMVPAKDGATNSFDVVVAPQIHIAGSIEIHQSKQSGR